MGKKNSGAYSDQQKTKMDRGGTGGRQRKRDTRGSVLLRGEGRHWLIGLGGVRRTRKVSIATKKRRGLRGHDDELQRDHRWRGMER